MKTWSHLIIITALTLCRSYVYAASSIPNDCWFGVMVDDTALHGTLVATGPVAQWRVGVPLVLYTIREDYLQLKVLADKGQTGTFDTSHPITVTPTWISGPESSDDNSIQVMMKFSKQGKTGVITMSYWHPISGREVTLETTQNPWASEVNQLLHDISCGGIP